MDETPSVEHGSDGLPVLGLDPAPAHLPGFWALIEGKIRSEPVQSHQVTVPSVTIRPSASDIADSSDQMGYSGDFDQTLDAIPAIGAAIEPHEALSPVRQRRSRPGLVGAAAALALACAGLIAFAAFGTNSNDATELAGAGSQQVDGSGPGREGSDDGDASPLESSGSGSSEAAGSIGIAEGSVGPAVFMVVDESLGAEDVFLANWREGSLSFFADYDQDKSCRRRDFAKIVFVNAAGTAVDTHVPAIGLSGEVFDFTLGEGSRARWFTRCGDQVEAYEAKTNAETGFDRVDLLAVFPNGTSIDISDVEATGIIAATPNLEFSFENMADPGGAGDCDEPTTLAVVNGEGTVLEAVLSNPDLGDVTAMAMTDNNRIAFADACGKSGGYVYIANLRADGRLQVVDSFGLSPYVPGFADELHFVDPSTLRVEVDNSVLGLDRRNLDYRLDEQVVVLDP